MKFSLNTKIILSMAGMVFLTALACCAVFLIIINNQTREFENRLDKINVQAPTPPPAKDVTDKIKTIVSNQDLSPDTQLQQIRAAMRNPNVDFDKIRQVAADSGWPISSRLQVGGSPSGEGRPIGVKILEDNSSGFLTQPMYNSIIIASAISVAFAVVLGFLLSRTVIRPLRGLERASERIADGNYNLVLKPEGKDDLGRLAASFNKMSKALKQTEQKRKDLVADVSHELRTPLSSIQGYTEVLRDGLVVEPQRRDEIYDHILNEVRHLTTMVNSMREWVNNEQSLEQLSFETFEVSPALQAVLDRFVPAALDKQVNLEVEVTEPEPKVLADADCLNHILSNLIDNALHYTPPGGSVKLTATALKKEKLVRFEVIDSGSGISAEHLPFIFERFYRVDKSRDRNTGGSGLGLAIVRDTVQAQGGDIRIESEVGAGTKVIFHLPSADAKVEIPREIARVPVGV